MSNIKKCEKTFCKIYTKKTIKKMEEFQKAFLKALQKNDIKKNKPFSITKKDKTMIEEECKKTYCNPGCKGTIYQNNSFPKELEKKFSKSLINILKKRRKEIFKGNKSVLINNFYKKLKDINVKKAKKKGAISGCNKVLI